MGLAPRSLTAFRLTKQEQAEISANDTDWVLDPRTGVLEGESQDEPEEQLEELPAVPRKQRRSFRLPDVTFD